MPEDKSRPPGSTLLLDQAFARNPFSEFVLDIRARHRKTQQLSIGQIEALERVVSGMSQNDAARAQKKADRIVDDWLAGYRLTRKDIEELAESRKRSKPPEAVGRFANIIRVDQEEPASSLEELRARRRSRP